MERANVPDDFSPGAVQAALFVSAKHESQTNTLYNDVREILEKSGCSTDGDGWLADGTPTGHLYAELPYLMLTIGHPRDAKIDMRLFYNRKRPSELQRWIDSFVKMAEDHDLNCRVYEPVSTGPF